MSLFNLFEPKTDYYTEHTTYHVKYFCCYIKALMSIFVSTISSCYILNYDGPLERLRKETKFVDPEEEKIKMLLQSRPLLEIHP